MGACKIAWCSIPRLFLELEILEEHAEQFYVYTGDYAQVQAAEQVVAWPWPGAEEPLWVYRDVNAEHFKAHPAYLDAEGREWGFVNYLYGSRNVWICLSDPPNRALPALCPASGPEPWASETIHADLGQAALQEGYSSLITTALLVVGCMVVTALLIKRFWKPNQTKQEEQGNE